MQRVAERRLRLRLRLRRLRIREQALVPGDSGQDSAWGQLEDRCWAGARVASPVQGRSSALTSRPLPVTGSSRAPAPPAPARDSSAAAALSSAPPLAARRPLRLSDKGAGRVTALWNGGPSGAGL